MASGRAREGRCAGGREWTAEVNAVERSHEMGAARGQAGSAA